MLVVLVLFTLVVSLCVLFRMLSGFEGLYLGLMRFRLVWVIMVCSIDFAFACMLAWIVLT